jgi:hypothetical protein
LASVVRVNGLCDRVTSALIYTFELLRYYVYVHELLEQ